MGTLARIAVPVTIAIVIILSGLVLLLVEGHITPLTFAASSIGMMAAGMVIWILLLRRGYADHDGDVRTLPISSRADTGKKRLQISLLLLFLAATFWLTRGGPMMPRLTGASFLLLFITGLAFRRS